MHCKNFGLTYPQCNVNKDELLNFLIAKHNDSTIVVCEEDHHETEGKHLHAAIMLEKQIKICKQDAYDYKGFHCNIQSTRNTTDWLKYVCKDGNYIVYPPTFDVDNLLNNRKKKVATISAKIDADIKKGATLKDIYIDYGPYMVLHDHQIRQYYNSMQEQKLIEENKIKWALRTKFIAGSTKDFNNARIAGWLNDNLLQTHKFRQDNLWITGPTKCGKTTLIEKLQDAGCNIHNVDLDSHFYDGLTEDTQLIVFDEFKAQKSITQMNKICDGSRCRVSIKGSSYKFTKPIPVIVLSNYTLEECYCGSDEHRLETLKGRFIHLTIADNEKIVILEQSPTTTQIVLDE